MLVIFTNYCTDVEMQYRFGWISICATAGWIFITVIFVLKSSIWHLVLMTYYGSLVMFDRLERMCSSRRAKKENMDMDLEPIQLASITEEAFQANTQLSNF